MIDRPILCDINYMSLLIFIIIIIIYILIEIIFFKLFYFLPTLQLYQLVTIADCNDDSRGQFVDKKARRSRLAAQFQLKLANILNIHEYPKKRVRANLAMHVNSSHAHIVPDCREVGSLMAYSFMESI